MERLFSTCDKVPDKHDDHDIPDWAINLYRKHPNSRRGHSRAPGEMRFYDIQITDESGNLVQIDGFPMVFTSYKSGVSIPGALNVEIDLPIFTEEIAASNGYVKIWGIGLSLINQASKLALKNIVIKAGMQKGLPLANLQTQASPSRNGIIFEGSILQAFGHWQGTEQTLDLVITNQLTAKPIVFNCAKSQSFSDAITKSIRDSGLAVSCYVDANLKASEPIIGTFPDLATFAQEIHRQSLRSMQTNGYPGVRAYRKENGYAFSDNSTPGDPVKIDFTDLVGQPTWLEYMIMQFKTVMRSDIHVGDTIAMPDKTIALGAPKSYTPDRDDIAYKGTAWVRSVRHVGAFRQPDANAWATIIEAIPN
jgi:hypothetical protein